VKRIWLVHVVIVVLILCCAFSPWIYMAVASVTDPEGLEDLGLAAGYIGMGLTPLGLIVAVIYVVAAGIYHFSTNRSGAKPISMGKYLLLWMGIVIVGAIVGWIVLTSL